MQGEGSIYFYFDLYLCSISWLKQQFKRLGLKRRVNEPSDEFIKSMMKIIVTTTKVAMYPDNHLVYHNHVLVITLCKHSKYPCLQF